MTRPRSAGTRTPVPEIPLAYPRRGARDAEGALGDVRADSIGRLPAHGVRRRIGKAPNAPPQPAQATRMTPEPRA